MRVVRHTRCRCSLRRQQRDAAAEGEFDHDRRVLKMLGARAMVPPVQDVMVLRPTDGNTKEAHQNLVGL